MHELKLLRLLFSGETSHPQVGALKKLFKLNIGHLMIRATYGNIWKHLATFGNIWEYLGTSGNIWKHLGTSGNIWQYLATSSIIWQHLASNSSFQPESKTILWKLSKKFLISPKFLIVIQCYIKTILRHTTCLTKVKCIKCLC